MGIIARGKKLSIRFKDAGGKWQTVATGFADTPQGREQAGELLAEAMREAGNAMGAHAGPPVRFRVIAVYSNGTERELAAVDTLPSDAYSDPGVAFQTDDEEFAVFVARRPRETDPATEVVFDRPADHKPDGAPF